LPVLLQMHRLRHDATSETRRLLRVLLVRLGAVSADPGRAFRRNRRRFLLCGLSGQMTNHVLQNSQDWLRSPRTSLLAWWIPQGAIVAGPLCPSASSDCHLDYWTHLDGNSLRS